MPGCTVLAPCGMDCMECERFVGSHDPVVAKQSAERFRAQGEEDASPEGTQCKGCRRDRNRCVTGDCRLYTCAVEKKGYLFCSDCETFPCSDLQKWEAGNERQRKALETLRVLYGSYTLGSPPS